MDISPGAKGPENAFLKGAGAGLLKGIKMVLGLWAHETIVQEFAYFLRAGDFEKGSLLR